MGNNPTFPGNLKYLFGLGAHADIKYPVVGMSRNTMLEAKLGPLLREAGKEYTEGGGN